MMVYGEAEMFKIKGKLTFSASTGKGGKSD